MVQIQSSTNKVWISDVFSIHFSYLVYKAPTWFCLSPSFPNNNLLVLQLSFERETVALPLYLINSRPRRQVLLFDINSISSTSAFNFQLSIFDTMSQDQTECLITYICTVSKACGSTFNDYAEWCYHEAIEHPCRFDIWYCEERPVTKPYICYWGFYTEEEFIAHRAKDHGDPDVHSDCHFLGPTLGGYFYCGFCQSSYHTDGVEWWRARSEHLKTHFKVGCTMVDWVEVEMH
jgi:hypothetical protein